MENKIKYVEKGWGDNSSFFTTNENATVTGRVDEIMEESKQVSNDLILNVYRGYKDGKLVFEMGACIDRIKEVCDKQERSISDYVRMAVSIQLDKDGF
jgi:hypothetical protein